MGTQQEMYAKIRLLCYLTLTGCSSTYIKKKAPAYCAYLLPTSTYCAYCTRVYPPKPTLLPATGPLLLLLKPKKEKALLLPIS